MKDTVNSFSVVLPAAAANTISAILDFSPEATGFLTNQWRTGFFKVSVPAMANHTNTSATVKLTLQQSSVNANANFANTDPLIEVQIAGVASTGSVAKVVKVPLNPEGKRYVRFVAAATANATTDGLTASFDFQA